MSDEAERAWNYFADTELLREQFPQWCGRAKFRDAFLAGYAAGHEEGHIAGYSEGVYDKEYK